MHRSGAKRNTNFRRGASTATTPTPRPSPDTTFEVRKKVHTIEEDEKDMAEAELAWQEEEEDIQLLPDLLAGILPPTRLGDQTGLEEEESSTDDCEWGIGPALIFSSTQQCSADIELAKMATRIVQNVQQQRLPRSVSDNGVLANKPNSLLQARRVSEGHIPPSPSLAELVQGLQDVSVSINEGEEEESEQSSVPTAINPYLKY